MGENSAIAWTDHTFNPWMGCTKVSAACDNCYAEALGKRTGRVQWGDDAPRVVTSDAYWRNPIKWNATAEAHGVRHRVFCASLADVFEDRPELEEHRERLWELIDETPNLDWLLLTKRPQHVLDMVPTHWLYEGVEEWETGRWPINVWIGTTVEDQAHADERVPELLRIPAVVRFLSCEPLLGPIDLLMHIDPWNRAIEHSGRFPKHILGPYGDTMDEIDCDSCDFDSTRGIDWVIVGGESGPGYRPLDLGHARSLREQCAAAGVPFFFKQVGGRFPHSGGDQLDGETIKEFPTPMVPA